MRKTLQMVDAGNLNLHVFPSLFKPSFIKLVTHGSTFVDQEMLQPLFNISPVQYALNDWPQGKQ